MIRLLLLFIPYIFFLIFTCYNFGELILSKINIKFNKYLQIAIGFISIIALFQLVFYPVMVLQLGSIFLTIIGIIVLAFLIGLDIKKIKNIKTVFKDKWIFLLLFLTVIVFFIYMRAMPNDYWFYDDSFYLPLMSVNSNTDKLFSIEPRIGAETSKITSIYMYQGYYMVGSFIISICIICLSQHF